MDLALDLLDLEELIVLAKLDLEANDLSGALTKLKLAKSKDGDAEVVVMLARLYARLGLFNKATPLFSEYLQDNPDALVEKFQYGMTFFDNKQLSKALEIFESILEQEANHPPAMFYSTLILSEQNKVEDAMAGLENILLTVDSKNLFYSRAHEELAKLDAERASKFTLTDSNLGNERDNVTLN